MPASASNCPLCGVPLPADTVNGCCPRCLMVGVMQPTRQGDAATALPPPTPDELAPCFPQLEILECLGRGGMGVVYKARQKSLNRLVALKLLAPERAGDPLFAARFEREAQALAALNHPHIVSVHDFGSVVPSSGAASGEPGGFGLTLYYLLMEFVDGLDLRQLLNNKRLSPQEALRIVPPVCEALQCAHDNGIVHCDIKPENLLIDKAGVVKIADFGIAKMIRSETNTPVCSATEQAGGCTSLAQGTPDYAAPEQAGGNADHRADIYSLGVVLYEMLTGERPKEKAEAPSKRVQVDLRVDEVVLKALQRQPDLRFATAADLRHSIEALIVVSNLPAAADGPASRSHPRRRMILALAAILLLALGIGSFLNNALRKPKAGVPGAEWVDFNMGHLSDAFSENIQFGKSHYGLTAHGLADCHGVVTAENMSSEGTLVYRKNSYDLSKLSKLELFCSFRRSEIGSGPQALGLGVTGDVDGRLSGVPGSAFMDLRLKAVDDTLRLEFQSKQASLGPPRSWESSNAFVTRVGSWYRLHVVMTPVDAQKIRVSGDLCELDRDGNAGSKIGFFLPRDFAEPIFPVKEIMEDHDVWVALRAHGPGGAALLDDLQILARPLSSVARPEN